MFGLMKKTDHEKAINQIKAEMNESFKRSIRAMIRVIASATNQTVEDILAAVAATVEMAASKVQKAEAKVAALEAELNKARAELTEARADLKEVSAVKADIEG